MFSGMETTFFSLFLEKGRIILIVNCKVERDPIFYGQQLVIQFPLDC